MCEILLAAGADPNAISDYWGRKPVDDAAHNGHAELVEFLLSLTGETAPAAQPTAEDR